MTGPLFRELAEALSAEFDDRSLLLTGHPDTIKLKNKLSDKLELVESPIYDTSSNSRRILSWIRYLISATRFILFSKKTDGFLLTSNPPILGIWFWLLNRLKNNSYFLLVYDIHPDIFITMRLLDQNSFVVKLWNWFNVKVYRDSEIIFTLGQLMSSRLARNYLIEKNKLIVIPPWVDTNLIKPISYDQNPLSQKLNPKQCSIVLYSGNMGISHNIETMLEASKQLTYRDDILFVFIGGGEKWQYANDFKDLHSLDNISIYPYLPEDQLPYSMALASISLVSLEKGAEELMIPSKLFYYLASGSAIIGICHGENELSKVIDGGNCGKCVEPNNVIDLVATIKELVDETKQLNQFRLNARQIAISNYSKKININKFIAPINQLKNSGK